MSKDTGGTIPPYVLPVGVGGVYLSLTHILGMA